MIGFSAGRPSSAFGDSAGARPEHNQFYSECSSSPDPGRGADNDEPHIASPDIGHFGLNIRQLVISLEY